MDPVWIAVALGCLTAALAAWAACRPLRDPAQAEALAGIGRELGQVRAALADELRRAREEAGAAGRELRQEVADGLSRATDGLGATIGRLGTAQAEKVDGVEAGMRDLVDKTERRMAEMRRDADEAGKALRDEVLRQLGTLNEVIGKTLQAGGSAQSERLDTVQAEIRRLVQSNAEGTESLRRAVEAKLETMRTDNAAKLEEMRRTVDEKLQGTLEQRLGESFKLVSGQLEQVHRSVGEMQALATGVGDLKRVLTNVKTRGTWAEVSLGTLLDQVLTPDQFARNVECVPGTGERVEFAVRLPGTEDGRTVWLPIDAKFPVEDWERLHDASERGDAAEVDTALKKLEQRVRQEGEKICKKYVSPPDTVDFGIMYLPTEGLHAEVLRRPGLVDHLQTHCRIMVAGPTNLHAFLVSLKLGFRTLAIEKRSSEVWQTLGAVKTEFSKYGDVLDAVRKKLADAQNQIEKVAVRKRAIDRKLREVESASEEDAQALLGGPDPDAYLEAAE